MIAALTAEKALMSDGWMEGEMENSWMIRTVTDIHQGMIYIHTVVSPI